MCIDMYVYIFSKNQSIHSYMRCRDAFFANDGWTIEGSTIAE